VPVGEALLGLRLGGICATDLELVRGYMGYTGVLGHEWVGRVLDHPDRDMVGQRVVGDINCPCGNCPTCLAGRPTHCPTRTVLGIAGRAGAFSERFALPVGNLHRVPEGVPDEAAVFVEPLAAACEIVQQVHVRPTDRVAVLGVGRLGQLCARVLALTGARVVGLGRSEVRLELLPRGIPGCSVEDLDGERFDVVVDCTGSPQGLSLATTLVRPRGTVVLKTTVHEPVPQSPTPWVIDELSLVGSRCGPFAPALRLLEAGLIDPTPLLSAHYPLGRGVQALAQAGASDTVKVVLSPGPR
jgi:alcohol dehydrogenase